MFHASSGEALEEISGEMLLLFARITETRKRKPEYSGGGRLIGRKSFKRPDRGPKL